MSGIAAAPYDPASTAAWNALNAGASAGHFLFNRGFMDYHADRFADASLVFERDGAPVAILPANRDGGRLHSHQGLTFGGIVHAPGLALEDVQAILDATLHHARNQGLVAVTYKALPAIYHRTPSEHALYALFRHGARLVRREASATIDYRAPGPRSKRRERGVRRSRQNCLALGWDDAWDEYWAVLDEVLRRRHNRQPVHSAAEIRLLANRFPGNIRLFTARANGAVVAGVVMFETPEVAHAQYIAASPEGQALSALDGVFDRLIALYADHKRCFDFGISTEDGGQTLNAGLAAYKREWGAGCIVHDTFEIVL